MERRRLGIPKMLEMGSIRGIWTPINRRNQANQDKWPKIWLKVGKKCDFLDFAQIGQV